MLSNIAEGSRIAVVAPAGPASRDLYSRGLKILAARYQLVQLYDPVQPTDAPLPYLAASDQTRAGALRQALADPQIGAVFCARGGYGSLRLLQELDPQPLLAHRPLLVGFSDITALHAWTFGLGVPSILGPVVTQLPRLPAEELQALWDLLEGRRRPTLRGLSPLVAGQAQGPLFGGNLTVLAHLCGTPFLPDLRGCILLLEETNEAPYRIDRALTQLELAGAFAGLAGVVVGELHRCDLPQGQPPTPVQARQVISERLGQLGLPVALGAPLGHGAHNLALPLGLAAHLDSAAGTLELLEK